MEGWKTLKLDDLAKIERGRFSPRPRNDPRYYGGNIPFVQTGDVSRAGIYIQDYSQTLNEKGLAVSKLFPKNTILMTIAANVGDVAILGFDSACPDSLVAFLPKNDVNHKWLFHVLKTMKNKFDSLSTQNAQKNLSLEKIKPIKIPVPPPEFQDEMAVALDLWDTTIEKTEALIRAKQQQFSWFRHNVLTGKVRLAGYNTPWEQQVFGSVMKEHKLTSTGTEEVHSVSVHKGVINQIEHLGRSFSAQNTDHYNLVHPGDIIYTKSPTGDFPFGIIKQSKLAENVIVSPLYGVFTPRSYELGVILDAYFESYIYTENYLRPIIQKGAKNTISCTNKAFLSRGLLLPVDREEEKALAEYISTSKAEIRLLQQLAEKYRTQKRGLMQKLLTGEWRVGGDKEAAA